MYTDLFKRINESAQKNALTFFVGAGVSKISNVPTWKELIDAFCKKLNISTYDYSNDDYLSIPQKYYYSIQRNNKKYYSFLKDNLGGNSIKPNHIHSLIYSFGPANIVTTNFDDLLEKSAVTNCLTYKSIASDAEVASVNGDKYILKVHGDLAHKNVVLKEEDYLNYSENFKLIETLLKSIFSTNTVVFIGYGLNDYNIRLVLNWSKTLTNDINKPIFIYTDDKPLDDYDIIYHESRGLKVIDYNNFIDKHSNKGAFIERYELILTEIHKHKIENVSSKNKIELFEVLYNLLVPLDKFNALRTTDIHKSLYPNAIVDESGVLHSNSNGTNIIQYFCELNQNTSMLNATTDLTRNQYELILRVLSKARIYYYYIQDTCIEITGSFNCFSDHNCILFNYSKMEEITQKHSGSVSSKYAKAFYYAKIKHYQEAYNIFKEVAIESYRISDYFMYYLSQMNKLNIYRSMKSINRNFMYMNMYVFDDNEKQELEDSLSRDVFGELPIEFKNQYINFGDLCSVNSLYKNSYETLLEAQKLESVVDTHTMEMGITSCDKAFARINNNLHFYLGNHILKDEFAEFKNTIKYLMTVLVYRYATQGRECLTPSAFPDDWRENNIRLDEIDFYCFVEYFSEKEIHQIFKKHNLKTIVFENSEIIEMAIINLFDYYVKCDSSRSNNYVLYEFQRRIQSCARLLEYMDLSQKIVDIVTRILFEYEYREIYINDKLSFAYSQLYIRKMASVKTNRIIENTLIKYIQKHMNSIDSGRSFGIRSTSGGVHYWNMASYLSDNQDKNISKRLSDIVVRILAGNYPQLIESVLKYYPHINKKSQKEVRKYVRAKINEKFDFVLLTFMVSNDIKATRKTISDLKTHLRSKRVTYKNGLSMHNNSLNDQYEDLINVGYWCSLGLLNSNDFVEFKGLCDKYDFFYCYREFDYSKFDVSWMLNLRSKTHREIAANQYVRENIRKSICATINEKTIDKRDYESLLKIVSEYYC